MTWFSAHAGTILVLLLVALLVGLAVRQLVADRRHGRSACHDCAAKDDCAIYADGKSCCEPKQTKK